MTTSEKIEVMQAHLDGKSIQFCLCCDVKQDQWFDLPTLLDPVWDWSLNTYRIKLENPEK